MIDEIKAEVKILKYINLKSLLCGAVGAFIGLMLSSMVYSSLVLPFIVYNAVIGFLLASKSKFNSQKRNVYTLLFYFRSFKEHNQVYETVDCEPYEDDVIGERYSMYKKIDFEGERDNG